MFSFSLDSDMKSQKGLVASTVTKAVEMLTKLDELVPVLKSLGRRHVNYGVKANHYNAFYTAFMGTLEAAFGDQFTPELKESWSWVLGVIANVCTILNTCFVFYRQ